MTRASGPHFDNELRETLRRRDPGDPPPSVRTWLLEVPDEEELSRQSRFRRPRGALLAAAALILLAVIGATTIRHAGLDDGLGGSTPSGSTASASPAASPSDAFDPTIEGPGISAADDLSPAIVVAIACVLLVGLATTISGRRRSIPAGAALLLAGWALAAAFVPITLRDNGYGLGLNTVYAPKIPGSEEELLYELAPPNGRFSLGLYLFADGPIPVRIEGIVSPNFGRDRRSFAGGLMPTALWMDGEPNGGMTGPIRPFAPFDMPRSGQSVWLVGLAGPCAVGPAFDPSDPPTGIGYQSMDSLDVRVSVFGWPRTVHLALPFRMVEPTRTNPSCSG